MLRWVQNLWHQHQRKTDLQILWPECKRHASDIDHARAAFAAHAFNDPAWLSLGTEEIFKRINDLGTVAEPPQS